MPLPPQGTARIGSAKMIKKPERILVVVGLVVLTLAAWNVAAATGKKWKKGGLPPAAEAAVKKAFPNATLGKVERGKESVVLYEVYLVQDGKKMEVEVSADGLIAETEEEVAEGDLPEAVAKTLRELAGDGKVKEIEKSKTLAVVKLVKLAKPLVVYEIKIVKDGKEFEVGITEDGKSLGKKVEDDYGHERYEKSVSLDEVPSAVKATILKEAAGKEIKEIEVTTWDGKEVYEAEWMVAGKEVEIKIAADGRLLGKEVEDHDDD